MREETIGTIRVFKTANFTVRVDALPDYDVDLSWDETGETLAKLESGEYVSFCARVLVVHNKLGEVGSDYLGGCIYSDIADFQDHRECGASNRELKAKGDLARCGSYFAQMIRDAIAEARRNVSAAQAIYIRQ